MDTIYDVLEKTGYASRTTEIADNFDRNLKIESSGGVVAIVITREVRNLKLSAKYAFNLNNRTTTATPKEVAELRHILEIKPF